MGQCLSIVLVAGMEEKVEGRAVGVRDSGHLGGLAATVNGRAPKAVSAPHILHKGRVDHQCSGRPLASLDVELYEIMESTLEYVQLGPDGKVVIDGLPRAALNVEMRPLAARSEDMGDTIENVT